MSSRTVALVVSLLILATQLPAQSQNPPKTDADLVLLTLTVRNKSGNFIMGVPRESFALLDEKETPPIEFFENVDSPMSIGLLVDTSDSMQFYETKDIARAAAIGESLSHFVELSNPKSEFFVLAFDSQPRASTDWKSGQDLLANKIPLSTEQRNNTAFYDAVLLGMQKFETAHYAKRALVVFTDGQDTSSKATFNQLRDRLRRSDISLYAVGIIAGGNVGSALGMEGQGILDELTETTGGDAIYPHDKKEMRAGIEMIATEFRHQYRLGFRATNPPGRWHRLKVKITPRPSAPPQFQSLSAKTRPGYYAN